MISNGLHEDYSEPPDIPAFSGNAKKRSRKDSLSDSLSGAAVALVNALKPGNSVDNQFSPSTGQVLAITWPSN